MTTTQPAGPSEAGRDEILADITAMIGLVLEDDGLDGTEVGMRTRFARDLEFESIDLVTLAGHLEDRYGHAVNFAEFMASMELDDIIELTVGRLVEHVAQCLKSAEAA
ncbi:phosphopantetheine-binding protein [Streptomyces sp. NBC_01619]|uniref:Phosphopantetheine-binding protein n=1 Tax=Streptomyces pratisoli TaxID=3139917 RepID=A0ACC6QTL7_9ACTN|nr:phosphopantetheine-binding protein [Streptomyces sp. NBC_01619]MCX4513800.1 phosphopantetheine-binding protein [Streptomyces sp. NBC_01619]